jgi:hypothetical protein
VRCDLPYYPPNTRHQVSGQSLSHPHKDSPNPLSQICCLVSAVVVSTPLAPLHRSPHLRCFTPMLKGWPAWPTSTESTKLTSCRFRCRCGSSHIKEEEHIAHIFTCNLTCIRAHRNGVAIAILWPGFTTDKGLERASTEINDSHQCMDSLARIITTQILAHLLCLILAGQDSNVCGRKLRMTRV